jgi:thymidylate synthase
MEKIAAVGNLYSPNLGIDFLLANLLAHPYLYQLIIVGVDKGLVSVIEGEDPNSLLIPGWFPKTREWFEREYLPIVIEPTPIPEDLEYTYADRLRLRWGDQLERLTEKLRASPNTRQAVAVLWDPAFDLEAGEVPCINHLWFRISHGKLYLIVTIRSNDMYEGFPENALAMRVLQERIRKAVNPELGLGSLVLISESAHIYGDHWGNADRVVEGHWKDVVTDDRLVRDPGGDFTVEVEGDSIVVRHLAPRGEVLQEWQSRTAQFLLLQVLPFVCLTGHAAYLGAEITRAEMSLRFGVPYTQDRASRP